LWLAARDAADAAGYRLLSCRSSEAEAGFSFAGLTDLLGDVVDEALSDLPPGRKRSSERLAYQSGRTWCYKPR
jgi:hypothetical protein